MRVRFKAAEAHASNVKAILDDLSSREDLSPSAEVNKAFTDLVNLAYKTDREVCSTRLICELGEESVCQLHGVCAKGEACMERHWAKRIIEADDGEVTLQEFPYLQNYYNLAKMEMQAINKVAVNPVNRILFVGAGPLPLSSYMFNKLFDVKLVNVDVDHSACHLAQDVLGALKVDAHHECVHKDASQIEEYQGFDVVALAALVGLTPADKLAFLKIMYERMVPGQLLLVRSVRGMRKILYPEVAEQLIEEAGFTVKRVVHPRGEVINSAIIAVK